MTFIKLVIITTTLGLLLTGCRTSEPEQTIATTDTTAAYTAPQEIYGDDYWAKDNFDLQRVGSLLERSNSPQEFESYLNSNDGINNLDLNGDGYVDYISVREFDDRDSNSRGLSLFSRFGPDMIQEIAQIFLYRDSPDRRGAQVLIRGNDRIYGDNNYYEANWVDRSVGLISTLFGGNNDPYRSPYYYDNYPSQYQRYEVVEPAYYRTRIEQLYPQPAFVYTPHPVWVDKVKIKSPNNGLHLGHIKARLVKPDKSQEEFYRNNPREPRAMRSEKDDRNQGSDRSRDYDPRSDDKRSDRSDRPKEKNETKRDDSDRGNNGRGVNNPGNPGKGNKKADRSPGGDNGSGGGKGKGKGKP
jgi:hypothetical protein